MLMMKMIFGRMRGIHSKRFSSFFSTASSTFSQIASCTNATSKLFTRASQSGSIDDTLPLIQSLLQRGEPDEAEAIWEGLKIRFPSTLPRRFSLALGNLFIHSWLSRCTSSGTSESAEIVQHQQRFEQKAREWYVKMRQEYALMPNEQTFCLFLDYCAKKGKLEDFRAFLQEFQHYSSVFLSLDELLQQGLFREPEAVSKCLKKLKEIDNEKKTELLDYSNDKINLFQMKNTHFGGEQMKQTTLENVDSNIHVDFMSKFNQLFAKIESSNINHVNPQIEPYASSSFPEIKEQKSKADGISFVKQSLQSLNLPSSSHSSNKNQIENIFALQEALERDSLNATISRLTSSRLEFLQMAKSYNLDNIRLIFSDWISLLVREIPIALAALPQEKRMKRENFTIHEMLLKNNISVQKLAIISLLEIFRIPKASFHKTQEEPFLKFVSLASAIGTAIEREILASKLPKSSPFKQKITQQIIHLLPTNRLLKEEKTRESLSQIFRKSQQFTQIALLSDWTPTLRVEIGAFMLQLCIKHCEFKRDSQSYSALMHKIIRNSKGESQGIIQIHPFILEEVSKEPIFVQASPSSLPMLVPPLPWLTCDSGGYLSHKALCVRLRGDATQRALLKSHDENATLKPVLLGLDVLGSTAWMINEPVLQVMIEAWNSKLSIANLPPFLDASTMLSQAESDKERIEIQNRIQSNHSQRCDLNYKLEIAKSFAGKPFYFPHNIDFRGRAYPIPPHFNHIGSDICRGLLTFHEKRPLGKRGFFWLQVHLANVYGHSKCTLAQRQEFTQQNLPAILESAKNPLSNAAHSSGGEMQGFWWTKADDPWQCLATCKEIAAALEWPHGLESFPSNLPVHQDGSCNGPQHYAALGRDSLGASKVNLQPLPTPQDIYATVAEIVECEIAKDLNSSCSEIQSLASLLAGKITRKIVKQPVMTNVYGVTNYGAQKQIKERLKEFGTVPQADYAKAANYISKKVFHALDQLFSTARQLQNWLAHCAKEISLSISGPLPSESSTAAAFLEKLQLRLQGKIPHEPYPETLVSWTSPIGFPAVQPYRKDPVKCIRTSIQTVSVLVPSEEAPVDVHKQVAGFPPNFIHSLDASHMFRTAISCNREGITFASVHDSFWTHASCIDEMGAILRREFVRLHKQPIMQQLREEFLQKYGANRVPVVEKGQIVGLRPICIPELPPLGDFDVDQVMESVYFFS